MTGHNPILVAIDTQDARQARALAAAVRDCAGGVKLGLEFFTANGPQAAQDAAFGENLFLDLKLHDIPNTVARAVQAVAPLKPLFLTVHASGGIAMMRAAAEAVSAASGRRRTRILGVTVLTSLDRDDLASVGQAGPPDAQTLRLARLAQEAGLDGVVCSPLEVPMLRQAAGAEFLLVVPGIRPAGTAAGDQKRVTTPRAAIEAGADYLVIGRPITESADPGAAARAILAELR